MYAHHRPLLCDEIRKSIRPYNRVCNKAEITGTEVATITQFFGTTPFTWVVDAQDEKTIAVLHEQGLRKGAEFPAMMADITQNLSSPHPQKLTLSRASSPAEVEAWIHCTASIYNYNNTEFTRAISYLRTAGNEKVTLYSGWHDGTRVCTGMVMYHDKVVTLHVIGTVPEYRNRGFGYDFTQQLLHRTAQAGCTHAALIATPAGASIYNKCGFTPYAHYHFYGLPTAS